MTDEWLDRLAVRAARLSRPKGEPLSRNSLGPTLPRARKLQTTSGQPTLTRRRGVQLAAAAMATMVIAPLRFLVDPDRALAGCIDDCRPQFHACKRTASNTYWNKLPRCVFPTNKKDTEHFVVGAVLPNWASAALLLECWAEAGYRSEVAQGDCNDEHIACIVNCNEASPAPSPPPTTSPTPPPPRPPSPGCDYPGGCYPGDTCCSCGCCIYPDCRCCP
jgi:hypothetical protein